MEQRLIRYTYVTFEKKEIYNEDKDKSQKSSTSRNYGKGGNRKEYHKKYYIANKSRLQAQKKIRQKEKRLEYLLRTIRHRCESPKHRSYRWYGGKGVRNFLTLEDLEFLWQRDNAEAMKRPTIDRKDGNGDYTLDNSRFTEHEDNLKRSWENKEERLKTQSQRKVA